MKQGALIFNERTDRYDIRFGLGDYYGGLHCGDTLPRQNRARKAAWRKASYAPTA